MFDSSQTSSSNPFISLTVQNQELERLKFSQNLRKNPAEYSAYVNDRINSMTQEVSSTKDNAFKKAQIDLSRYMDMDHNANFYRVRNNDVDRLTQTIASNNAAVSEGILADKQNSKRQFEINEWYNNNKLETLFFLQLFFVASLIMIILVSLHKRGTISGPIAATVSAIIAVIVGIIGVWRYMYTEQARDPRLWNRRKFGKVGPPPAKKAPDCPSDPTVGVSESSEADDTFINNVGANLGACVNNYGTNAKASVAQLGSAVNSEVTNFATTGKVKIDYAGALNRICPGTF
jgi:hypothetical protein